MKNYIHNGAALPAELLEKIAADVRAFDQAQTPEARGAASLKEITTLLTRVREELAKGNDQARQRDLIQNRIAFALEIQAAAAAGVDAHDIAASPRVQHMLMRAGLIAPSGEEDS
ncbi:hypothetical protein DEJ49_33375 [Streptomyces venezuelae]|uniref:Uncharacterized protein n=1 Tax=Streptomyces venezuelae TaxID=54571 RepID=A0A5P2CS48_STRVZ|nr:hypothetical protein [Streptomyces venezuelae]QES45233.1 hypothetical protein DEJ49_33375 [Streptomyces venezuelae]